MSGLRVDVVVVGHGEERELQLFAVGFVDRGNRVHFQIPPSVVPTIRKWIFIGQEMEVEGRYHGQWMVSCILFYF